MDKESRKFYEKAIVLVGSMIVACYAMYLGHDGQLAALTILGLFGGEKLLEKLFSRGQ